MLAIGLSARVLKILKLTPGDLFGSVFQRVAARFSGKMYDRFLGGKIMLLLEYQAQECYDIFSRHLLSFNIHLLPRNSVFSLHKTGNDVTSEFINKSSILQEQPK